MIERGESSESFRQTMAKRFQKARELLGMSQTEIAKRTGIALRSWQAYERGDRLAGAEAFACLASLNVNVTWFFTEGETSFFRDPLAETASRAEELRQRGAGVLPDTALWAIGDSPRIRSAESLGLETKLFLLPVYHWLDEKGNKVDRFATQREVAFSAEYMNRNMGTPFSDLSICLVVGDAMEPTLSAGDWVVFHRAGLGGEDGIYVVKQDGDARVRRLQFVPGNRVRVMSDNSAYQMIEHDLSSTFEQHFKILGRVVWAAKSL